MISIKSLKEMNACKYGIEWYNKNKKKTMLETLNQTDNESINYCNWYITKVLNKDNKNRYAIYAAEQVIDIYENKYPNDDGPRKAIEAAKNYLNNQTVENENTYAADAAYTAYASTYAAAYAAVNAAYADADYVAIADYNMKKRNIQYGITLLEDQKASK